MTELTDEKLLELNLVHPIHTTERRSFRSCRRRWNWIFREFYYPTVQHRALEFGIAFHEAMETWYDPVTWKDPERELVNQSLALTVFNNRVKEQLNGYRKLNGEPSPELKADYEDRVALGRSMIKYYTDKISPMLDKGFTPVGVEVPFEISLGFNCKCDICWRRWITSSHGTLWAVDFFGAQDIKDLIGKPTEKAREAWKGLPVTYGGRVDMIAQDNLGRLWLFDWKTTAKIMEQGNEESFLELEDQVTSYVVAFHRLGRPVAGFVYHEQKKAVPEPPQELTRMVKGRKFSTAKNANTTFEIFEAHVAEHDSLAYQYGLYDDYIAWLRRDGPQFYQRHQVHRNRHQIETAWNDMVAEARDIIENPRIYPQPSRFGCNTCAFRQPCLGANMGEDYRYTLDTLFEKRTKHYFEEQEENVKSTTDQKA